ncbi:uncharacterized protein TNCV_1057811 [Trichonephila clavipes]|nr:uncharacterized protein TNCV_1057811 [Trichonephila clavipes]
MQPGSNESEDCRKKGTGFKEDQGERHTGTASNRKPLVRSPTGSCNDLPHFRKRFRTEETMMPSTSGNNLRPRGGAKVESRPANKTRSQQGGPVRSRRSREKQQYNPYAEEQRRSSSRNARSRRGQQQHCQELKGGANSQNTHSLEVLVGDVNYKT